jgi:putative ABC transport system permease protein
MMTDLRIALRLLRKDTAFTVTAALTLALCIGANTVLFSVVNSVLLRPLPIPNSERIVLMSNTYPKAGAEGLGSSGVPDYYDRIRDVTVLEDHALFNTLTMAIDQNGSPTRVEAMNATPSLFRLLKTRPAYGRTFSDAEGEIGNEKKAILSYALWQSAFGGDPRIVGKDTRIDGQPYTVVGVMPRDFMFMQRDVMLWVPAAFTAHDKSDERRHSNNFRNVARLKPGATIQQAQAQVDALNAANMDRFPQYKELLINAGFHTVVTSLQDFLVRDVRPILYLLWGGALFVLLIGAVNVANLVLARSRVRVKELATRLAIGAGRLRVARQLMTESLILTLASAVVGLTIAFFALRLLGTLNIQDLPRGTEIRIDGVAIAYTLGLAALIGLALGLIPVATVLPRNLTLVLREEGRSGTAGRGARALRRSLVVAQVAFAFILLAGAGLLFASFRQILNVDPGFVTDGVLTVSINLPRARYPDDKAIIPFETEALRRLRALPGVTTAGATTWIPLSGNNNDSVILAEGYQMKPGESVISPANAQVTPGYFEAMGVALARGRFFDTRDSATGPKSLIIDEKLARRFWPNQDPIGRRMYLPDDINNLTAITPKTIFLTVVGVIKDVKMHDLAEGARTVGTYFYPLDQNVDRSLTFAVKTTGDPNALVGSVRRSLSDLDRELPVFDVQTMEQRMERSLMRRRSPVLLSLSFGAVALFLSAIGIYGVLAYLVTQRRREIGIRIALGSSAGAIVALVVREGAWLIGIGFVVGAAGAVGLRRAIESQLFGVSATDPFVLATVTGLLAASAVLACMLPARRAARIDPVIALAE